MRKSVLAAIALALASCGGGDDDSDPAGEPAAEPAGEPAAEPANAASGGGGEIADPQPSGQAFVSVDGLEFTLTEPGAVACTITDEAITFGFRIGDNEVTLGGGANRDGDAWFGSINLLVYNIPGQEGASGYYPDLIENGTRLTIDGSSLEYAGPMLKQPPNDGSNPPPVDIGDGVISVTC